ncbi:hypothetical protein BGZ96_008010 [Linnemannia gamsii]|uniref:tRNA-uridine aminocarboxypropyltransferase n=1 Tax=Linnemannia gamsii TaxID=64522 RepID=A0ABQ7KF64_9FUNG|nr:hypothetical protein BGZ96_008010 [Linnemannia gamsii]
MSECSVKLTDLSDQILLRIFSFIAAATDQAPVTDAPISKQDPSQQNLLTSSHDFSTPEPDKLPTKQKKAQKKKKNRVAGLGARTLCRLCCCSQRLNHLASADQLWQGLALARFPDRHWPTTDQKNLDMIRIRREHQLKLLAPSTGSLTLDGHPEQEEDMNEAMDQPHHQENGERDREGQNKKQKRTKFYSRFEQRAHRRKFASLDPELRYTPLAWTNTFWTWKRTFFGNCRFVESKDVSTPNRIDKALDDPNCTPLLLYPSHAAVDIHTLAQTDTSTSTSSTRYFCHECTHSHEQTSADASAKTEMVALEQDQINDNNETLSPYPYKLIIALDGSWSHAKIMYRCNPRLQQLTQIKFPNPPQSIYHDLKPEPKVTYTSTAEAVSQAVALLGWPTNTTGMPSTPALTDAQLLHEDIIRPLRKMIEIQDTIQDQQKLSN